MVIWTPRWVAVVVLDLSGYLSIHQIHTHKQIRTVTYISGLNPSLGRLSWNTPVLLLNSSVPYVTCWAPYHFSPSEKKRWFLHAVTEQRRIKFLSLIAHWYLETSFIKCWRKHVLCLIWHRRDRGKGNACLRSSTTNLCYTGTSLTGWTILTHSAGPTWLQVQGTTEPMMPSSETRNTHRRKIRK